MEEYYHQNYHQYHRATFNIDPTSFLEPLAKELKTGARILDVGCGSGRDLVWLQKRNYKVMGFERSAGLAKLAKKHAGCEVIQGDFETHDFSNYAFDAMLLCGTLVHIPHPRMLVVLRHIIQGVRDGGLILISLKAGDGCKSADDHRVFYLWKDGDLRELMDGLGLTIIAFQRSRTKLKKRDIWLSYVLRKNQ